MSERAKQAYVAVARGETWEKIAAETGYATRQSARAAVREYAFRRDLAWPPKPDSLAAIRRIVAAFPPLSGTD